MNSFLCKIGLHDWAYDDFKTVWLKKTEAEITLPLRRRCLRCSKTQISPTVNVRASRRNDRIKIKDLVQDWFTIG